MHGQCYAKPAVIFPTAEHYHPSAGIRSYCLVTGMQRSGPKLIHSFVPIRSWTRPTSCLVRNTLYYETIQQCKVSLLWLETRWTWSGKQIGDHFSLQMCAWIRRLRVTVVTTSTNGVEPSLVSCRWAKKVEAKFCCVCADIMSERFDINFMLCSAFCPQILYFIRRECSLDFVARKHRTKKNVKC